jgi:hypothetical protein
VRQTPAGDLLGLLSVRVVLILFAVTYLRHPGTLAALVAYVETMVALKTYVKPPQSLLDAASFLFYAAGLWGLVLAALRLVVQRSMRKAVSALTGGVFALVIAYLVTGYATDLYTGRATVAYFIIAAGVLVIVNAVIQFQTRPRRRTRPTR